MASAGFNGEMFVNGSLQVVVAGYVRALWRPICGHYVMRRDLGTTATIVKFERGVDVTAGTVDVHFCSGRPAITHDCVAKSLEAASVTCPQVTASEKQSAERCETKRAHGSVLCHQPDENWFGVGNEQIVCSSRVIRCVMFSSCGLRATLGGHTRSRVVSRQFGSDEVVRCESRVHSCRDKTQIFRATWVQLSRARIS